MKNMASSVAHAIKSIENSDKKYIHIGLSSNLWSGILWHLV
jgi:hypothetical protein